MFYALFDKFELGKKEYSHGFANTKWVMAFTTKAARDGFLSATYDLSAKAVSRAAALRLADRRGEGSYVLDDEIVICVRTGAHCDTLYVAKKGA